MSPVSLMNDKAHKAKKYIRNKTCQVKRVFPDEQWAWMHISRRAGRG